MQIKLSEWLKLLRIPNIFTVPGDILAGFLFVHINETIQFKNLIILSIVSACLYFSGIILNDIFDRKKDEKERSERPLAKGTISFSSAVSACVFLMVLSLVLSAFVGIYSLVISIVIVILIVLYNGFARKAAVFGYITMGLCRGTNIILGGSEKLSTLPYLILCIAMIETLYIIFVTAAADKEAEEVPSEKLIYAAGAVIMTGLTAIMLNTKFSLPGVMSSAAAVLIVFIIANNLKNDVKLTTGIGKIGILIRNLIFLQAAFILTINSGLWKYAVLLYMLWIPSMFLGKRISGS